MDKSRMERGAHIIIDQWVNLKPDESLCIVTSNLHYQEALMLEDEALKRRGKVSVMIVPEEGIHVGNYFDDNPYVWTFVRSYTTLSNDNKV